MIGTPQGGSARSEEPGLDPLAAAARGVLEAAASDDVPVLVEPGELREAMELVIERVDRGRRSGEGPQLEPEELDDPALADRIAKALRAELLARWDEGRPGTDPEATLAAVKALEDFRTALWSDPREENLEARLSEPDAFELTVGLAHDLRSPLSSILFLAETLRSGHSGSLNDLQKSQLGLIYSASFAILSVANDVMEMAKAGRAGDDTDPSAFSVEEVLHSVEEMVRPMAEEKEVGLEVRVPETRPRIGKSTLLGRVMLNLIANALKFTDEGGVTVTVEKEGPAMMRFSVRDTGRGISPEKQDALFRPFRTSGGREGSFFSSSGLGLTIVRRLLAAMDAELEYETEEGEGTRFYFDLDLPPARSR